MALSESLIGRGPTAPQGKGLSEALIGRGANPSWNYSPVPQYTPAQQKTISSFKTLDPVTRQTLVTHFQTTDPAKYQLLKDHVTDKAPATPNYQDNSPTGQVYRASQGLKGVINKTAQASAAFGQNDLPVFSQAFQLAKKTTSPTGVVTPKNALKAAGGVAKIGYQNSPVGALDQTGATVAASLTGKPVRSLVGTTQPVQQQLAQAKGPLSKALVIAGIAGNAAYGAGGALKVGQDIATRAQQPLVAANKDAAAQALKIHDAPSEAPKALPAPSGKPLTTTPKALPPPAGTHMPDGSPMTAKPNPVVIATGKRVAKIDTQLNDFKTNPKTTITPENAKILQKQRNDLVAGRTQVTLDKIAGKHSAETGQPLASAHETVKAGNSPYSAEYAATQVAGKQAKMTGAIGHDWVEPSERTAAVPKENGTQVKATTQTPQKSAFESIPPAAVSRKFAGMLNPQRAAGREGNLDLAAWANDHTGRVNLRELNAAKAESDYKAVLNKNGVSHEDVIKSVEAGGHTGNAKVDEAAQLFAKNTKAVGQEGVANDTLKGYHENYVPRVGKFQDQDNAGSNGAFGLSRNHRFNNERQTIETTDANGHVTKTDKYPTHADFTAAVQKMGGQVQGDISKLLRHVLSTQGRAVENAKSVKALEDVTMRDGRPAITKNDGSKATAGYKNVGGRFVHPEAVQLYRAITEGGGDALKGLGKANSFAKQVVTINGLIHGKNFTLASVRNQGAVRTAGAVLRLMASPLSHDKGYSFEDVQRLVSHGLELSQTSASNLYDQFGKSNNKFGKAGEWLGAIHGATQRALFETYGDHLGVTTGLRVEKLARNAGLSADEAARAGAEAGKATIFSIPKAEQSIAMRNTSRLALFAGKYLQSTFKMGTNATGVGLDKTLSKEAQNFTRTQAQKAIVRGFGLTFLSAQALNYKNTGRFTWQNPDGAKKLEPVLYHDPKTGKDYYATNFYGQIGDLVKTFSDPVKEGINKLAPGANALANILANHDQYQQTNGGQIYDPNASGIDKVVSVLKYAAEKEFEPAGFQLSSTGPKTPLPVQLFKGAGYSASSAQTRSGFQNQILTEYQKTLPAGDSAETPAQVKLSADETQAHYDLSKGKTNSPAVTTLKGEMSAASFKQFLKTGANSSTQREFDKLSEPTKINILLKATPKDVSTLDYKTFGDNLIHELKTGSFDTSKGVSVSQAEQALAKAGYPKNSYAQALKDYSATQSASRKAAAKEPKKVSQL